LVYRHRHHGVVILKMAKYFITIYGIASIHESGQVDEEVWNHLIQPERGCDPEKKEFAVLIQIDRAKDLFGQPLSAK